VSSEGRVPEKKASRKGSRKGKECLTEDNQKNQGPWIRKGVIRGKRTRAKGPGIWKPKGGPREKKIT